MKIAISGKMRSGKTLYADYLCSKYGFRKISFATPLKELALNYFGISKDSKNGRTFLQKLGSLGRYANVNLWVDKAVKDIKEEEIIVIDDLRFQTEALKLKDLGFILIRIESTIANRRARGALVNGSDISETDLDNFKFDYNINNNGSEELFYFNIDNLMKRIK